ncbi:Ig-like domain-containing protein, partial [Aeromonas enterica]
VTGVKPGMVDIGASFAGASAAAHPVTVFAGLGSLEVTPDSASLMVGDTQDLTATAHYDDGASEDVTTVARWSSSNTTVASVVAGKVNANANGSATILASYTDSHGISQQGSAEITVNSPVTVTDFQIAPATSVVAVGHNRQYTATVLMSDGSSQDVTSLTNWRSDNEVVASISPTSGLATGITLGSTSIRATYIFQGAPFFASAQLTVVDVAIVGLRVSPDKIVIPNGAVQNFKAYATLSDGTLDVDVTNDANIIWSTMDPSVGTINDAGMFTTVNIGSTEIKAYDVTTGTYGTAAVEVTDVSYSPRFGLRRPSDASYNFMLGESNNFAFRCGAIVDAIGTPELPMVGGTGGAYYTTSGLDISSVKVAWGNFQYDPGGVTISQIIIYYKDGSNFVCGQNNMTTNVVTGTWAAPAGEEIIGMNVFGDGYSHEIVFVSN